MEVISFEAVDEASSSYAESVIDESDQEPAGREASLKTAQSADGDKDVSAPHAPTPRAPKGGSRPKPLSHNTRTWVDCSGSFKVEAEFIGVAGGKIHLHKINGVKIAVSMAKMSPADIAYVWRATKENDNMSLSTFQDKMCPKSNSSSRGAVVEKPKKVTNESIDAIGRTQAVALYTFDHVHKTVFSEPLPYLKPSISLPCIVQGRRQGCRSPHQSPKSLMAFAMGRSPTVRPRRRRRQKKRCHLDFQPRHFSARRRGPCALHINPVGQICQRLLHQPMEDIREPKRREQRDAAGHDKA